MHPASIFRNDNKADALAFIAQYPFAALAVNGADGPVSALVPLVIDESGQTLLGHIARSNPFWQAGRATEQKAIAIFRGHDAYISPSFYPSKLEHGRAVPTWNYMALEVRGNITFETHPDAMMPYLAALTDKMESHRDLPWQISNAPADYIAKLSRAIIGFKLAVDDITYVKKLSQNKSDSDKQSVLEAFENSSNSSEYVLADAMKKDS